MSERNNELIKPTEGPIAGSVSRRDFLKLSAILAGSTLLLLNKFGSFEHLETDLDLNLPPLPADFKRFALTRIEPGLEQPQITEVALGSQLPNLRVSLLAHDQPEIQLYDSVQDVLDQYTQNGQMELRWID